MIVYILCINFNRLATTNQECRGSGRVKRLHLHRGVQAAACEAGYRGHWKPAHGTMAAADGAHKGDDGRDEGGEGHHWRQEGVLGPH